MKMRNSSLALSLICVVLLLTACGGGGKNGNGFGRDADAEYETLLEATYSDLDEACGVTREYLDFFSQRFHDDSHCDDVRLIQQKFYEMQSVLGDNEDSFAAFARETAELGAELSESTYPVVRNTWDVVYKEVFNKRKKEFLDRVIPDYVFANDMWISAREVCEEDYGLGWNITKTDELEIHEPIICDNELAKEASGTFRVHLEGVLGLRQGSVKVRILGKRISDAEGRTSYRMLDYSYLETTGDVPEK
jgi:hypothetical protein